MTNKFYILYGYKADEYGKLNEYSKIGEYNSLDDVNRAINDNISKYAKFVYKEDYYHEEFNQRYYFAPFILEDTYSIDTIKFNDDRYSKCVDASLYTTIDSSPNVCPIIICIVGASGSGKTALSLHLQECYNVPAICSYTTRPMREGEIDGKEHKFVKEFNVENPDDILAYTLYGGYHYWTTHSQIKHELVTYVIDKRGLDEFKNKWNSKYKIVSVLITRPNRNNIDEDRKLRDLDNPTTGEYDIEIINDFDNIDDFFIHAVDKIGPVVKKVRDII